MSDDARQGRTRGRQAEAAANDERILAAGVRVLAANPRAPISDIVAEAGVGVASLYRRFASRDDLVRRLALHAMAAIEDAARAALEQVERDPWAAFTGFIVAAMDAGAGSMSAYAGTFQAGDELNDAGARLGAQIEALLTATRAAGVVRGDITGLDVLQLFEMLRAVNVGSPERSAQLRRRYIELIAPALRAVNSETLSEPAPTWDEIVAVWNP